MCKPKPQFFQPFLFVELRHKNTITVYSCLLCLKQIGTESVASSHLSVQWHCSCNGSSGIDGKQPLVVDQPIMDLTACPQIWICSLNQTEQKAQAHT